MMDDILTYDPIANKPRPAWAVEAVDQLLYKIKNKNLWEIVDFVLSIWVKRYPEEHKAFLEDIKRYRKQRANPYAATKSKSQRELLIIPPLVDYLLYKIASDKIQEYGEAKFKRDFSKRYSALRPGDKY